MESAEEWSVFYAPWLVCQNKFFRQQGEGDRGPSANKQLPMILAETGKSITFFAGYGFLVLEQRPDAGCVRHGKRITMTQARVHGHLAASHLLGGYAGSLISIQAEDALLILLELG